MASSHLVKHPARKCRRTSVDTVQDTRQGDSPPTGDDDKCTAGCKSERLVGTRSWLSLSDVQSRDCDQFSLLICGNWRCWLQWNLCETRRRTRISFPGSRVLSIWMRPRICFMPYTNCAGCLHRHIMRHLSFGGGHIGFPRAHTFPPPAAAQHLFFFA